MAEDTNNNNQLDPGEDINGNGQLDSGLNGVGFNQPDWDDGVYDNLSESIAAEISYFLRNGILYRRVLLLRQPAYGGDQPTNTAGNPDPRAFLTSSSANQLGKCPIPDPSIPSTTVSKPPT